MRIIIIGISTSSDNVRTILESDFSPKIHPVREYFNRLPRLDPDISNYTLQLSQTVRVANSDKWLEYLVKWLVGVVANALHDVGCQNHTCVSSISKCEIRLENIMIMMMPCWKRAITFSEALKKLFSLSTRFQAEKISCDKK
ncbi:hypothetical protein EZS27_039854 [termite gut metagenome]|uniref:Uncharacterized protein n=1 Tax=termite gut metagenome TaxID=433724 RepID=A0A5J4PHY8_9ZZZZ